MVKAVKLLNKEKRKFNLYLVGRCESTVKENYKWLYKEGFVKPKSLKSYFKKCSIYVHPADFDPCPVSVFEAMSAGMIPIITKNVGQYDIFVENGLNELVLEDNSPEAIAKKILDIYKKPKFWKRKISLKCKKIARNYRKEKQAKLFKKKFYKLLNAIEN